MKVDWEAAEKLKEACSVEDPRPIYYFVSDITFLAFEIIASNENDFGFYS